MRKWVYNLCVFTMVVLVVFQIAACGSTPKARFYTLSSFNVSENAEHFNVGKPRKVIGIGPVAIAMYLDHPGITIRNGPNTVTRSELDRWSGSLNDEVARVFVENMGQLLAGSEYLTQPWLEIPDIDYRVQLNITRFDGPSEGPVLLNASWMFFGRERSLLASGDAAIAEPLNGEGYAATADAMSRALNSLSKRIAAEIKSVTHIADGKIEPKSEAIGHTAFRMDIPEQQ